MRLGLTHGQTALLLGSVQVLFITLRYRFQAIQRAIHPLRCHRDFHSCCSIILDRLILRRLSAKDTVADKSTIEEQDA